MNVVRALLAIVPLLGLYGCSGGGGSTPVASIAWEKFRHDTSNSGGGNGLVADNNGIIKWQTQIDQTPISSSPAIDINGTIYIATEGGTLAALNSTNGSINWSVCTCDAPGSGTALSCPSGTPSSLGKLISSPAVYFFNTVTYIFIGSAGGAGSPGGAVYMFQDNGTTRTCVARFQPKDSNNVMIPSSFISSPAFTTNPFTLAVSGVLIGATADVTQHGTMYALNSDGSLIWQYPRVGTNEGPIGAVTSSPALGAANAVYFTAADGNLYALANNGTFKWRFPIGSVSGDPFSASPITTAVVFAASADGKISAIDPDGSFRWQVSSPGGAGFVSSLAIGDQATTTPTLTPTIPPTPTPPPGASPTPTATVTPVFPVTTIFGVTTAGTLVLVDTTTGAMKMIPPPATPIVGPVVASPFTSADQFLVVAAADGKLHSINTLTGEEPTNWPVTLAQGVPIRSSPSVDNNGVIYVGADNGIVYAVGTP
jgi:outer membrane protein assembly factor BamB